jgi:dienelactone hydrolase
MSSRALTLMDEIMEPGSWFNAFVWKPIYVLQLLVIGLPWKYRTRFSVTQPRVFSFFKALRTSPPPFETSNLKIGAAGFCWGGRHTILLAVDTPSSRVYRHDSQVNSSALEPLIDCAFTAHPSFIEVPKDIEAITIPISVAVGENDKAMGAKNIQVMKDILENKKVGEHEVIIFPGAKHGFSIRTHEDDKHEMECAQQAEDQAISWFTRWFS